MFFLICKLSNETRFSQIIYCIDAYLWINGQYLLLRSVPQIFSALSSYCSNRILCITMVIISLSKIRGCFVFEFLSPQSMFRHCSFCSKCMFCFGLPDTVAKQPSLLGHWLMGKMVVGWLSVGIQWDYFFCLALHFLIDIVCFFPNSYSSRKPLALWTQFLLVFSCAME